MKKNFETFFFVTIYFSLKFKKNLFLHTHTFPYFTRNSRKIKKKKEIKIYLQTNEEETYP